MPTPKKNEGQADFVNRCIPIVVGEGVPQQEAIGRCFGIFSSSKNKSFTNINQLPEDVKLLPVLGQQAWMSHFNSAESLGKSPQGSTDLAWNKVKEAWRLDESTGLWTLKKSAKIRNGIMEMKKIINNTADKGFFKAWLPFDTENGMLKVIEKEVTLHDGATVTRKFLQGTASNTIIDKENEAVSPNFINKMKATSKGLNVFLEHDHTLEKTLGFVSDTGGDKDNFWAETQLEPEADNELVTKLLKKSANGIRLGYSIGGRATVISKGIGEDGKEHTVLEDGQIFEISVTPMPAGNETDIAIVSKGFMFPIQKSMMEVVNHYDSQNEEVRSKTRTNDKPLMKRLQSRFTDESSGLYFDKTGRLHIDKSLVQKDTAFVKALEEMVQAGEIKDHLWDVWWAFREAIHVIFTKEDMEPEMKREKIIMYAQEFGDLIVEMSTDLADLTEAIDEALTS